MVPPDIALAQLVNATAKAYVQNAPPYITYREHTHITGTGTIRQERDINRFVQVRQSDNVAVMRDLPNGGETQGQAFPIIPYFNPFTAFSFSYFANLKQITITLTRAAAFTFELPAPAKDVDSTVFYIPFWKPSYAAGSTDAAPHFSIELTTPQPRAAYLSDIVVDAQTHLPSHVVVRLQDDPTTIALDYAMLQGHWVITHGSMETSQTVGIFSFHVVADTTYADMTFPTASPDSRI
jgi:hypothetical protein